MTRDLAGLSPSERADLASRLAAQHGERLAGMAVAREAGRRAAALGVDAGVPSAVVPPLPSRKRWGWRRALRFAAGNRMLTPAYLVLYARYLRHRLRHPDVELQGMVFLGARVELRARKGFGRLSIGPWCWIGSGTRLRAHEGNVRLAPKVVVGTATVVNAFLDVEVGMNVLLSDWIYVCDFDHATDRLDVPIKSQGIVKTPVRIGADVWVGEKASILRGADIGSGSVIGAQTVVKGTVPPFSVVVGRPGRIIRSRLPKGMTVEEGLALQRAGHPIPKDPLTR